MIQDKLTRAERLRLEAFNQVNLRNQMRPLPLKDQFAEAEAVEQWLKKARDEAERNLRLDAEFEAQERVAEDDAVPDDETYRSRATEIWCNEEVQIDGDAMVSASDSGAWVQAWVWVDNSNLDEA